jgi:[ribosomal protein S5]-alanine N-acetyltransferase
VDEDLAERSVVALVGGEVEAFGADGHGRGVSAATPRHMPLNTECHRHLSEQRYDNLIVCTEPSAATSDPAGTVAIVDHILRTERLVLCPVTADDHAVLLAHWAAPEVRRFLFDGAILSGAEITEAIEASTRDFGRAGYGLWLIHQKGGTDLVGTDLVGTDLVGTDLVGTAGLRPLEDLGLEIFYSLAPGSWGRGYATEAARAVLDHALGPLGLPEVLAEVDEGNTASTAVIERLGMTPFDVVPGELGPMIRYRKTA